MKLFLLTLALLAWPAPAHSGTDHRRLSSVNPRAIYRIETLAGSALGGDGGAAIIAQLGEIRGIAVDRLGNVYLSDTDHHRVRKIDAAGTITTFAGAGTPGFSGDGGQATAAQLNLPYGLAVDGSGTVYVADLNNQRVRRIGADGVITTLAGGGAASPGDGGLATSAQLLTPRNVAIDAGGVVYISEFGGHRVRKVTLDGRIATVAGIGVAGFRGDGGPAVTAQLHSPAGLAVDRGGALYIADSENQRVRKILPGGQIATVLGGVPATALYTPMALAVDLNGNLFIADSGTVVREYTAAGAWASAAGSGNSGFSGDGGLATGAALSAPSDLAINLNGILYIADGIRVRKVDGNGKIATIAGDGYLHAIGDGGPAADALLNQPSSVWMDVAGAVWIADAGTERVRRMDSVGKISTVVGTGIAAPGAEAILATASTLNYPTGVALDSSGNVLIAESHSHRIREIFADGRIRTVMGTGSPGLGPEGLQPKDTQLRGPQGVCADRSGTVYIVDTGNQRVLRWPYAGVVTTAAGNGTAGAAGDGGPARFAQLNNPVACAADSFGNLFIADTGNHRIRKMDATGAITSVAGIGLPGATGDEGPATAAALHSPGGIAVDDNGVLYIADTANNSIRQVTADGVIHTIAGTGQAGFGGDGGPALSAHMDGPSGLLLDGAGEIYFADTNNNRVRRLVESGTVQPPPQEVIPPIQVVNAASVIAGPVAPGEIVTIFGLGMGPQAGLGGAMNAAGILANQLGGSEVRFDGVPAPLLYAQAGQINAQVPYTVAGKGVTHIEIFYLGQLAGVADLPVAPSMPATFPVVVQQDGSFNSSTNPAPHGTFLILYATGEGLTDGPNLAGLPSADPYPRPVLPVTVSLGGIDAETTFAGSAPGLVGVMQVNVRIPGAFLPSGGAVLRLMVGTTAAPDVTVWVQ